MERKEKKISQDTFYADMHPGREEDDNLESCLDMFLEETGTEQVDAGSGAGLSDSEEQWETDFWGERIPQKREKVVPDKPDAGVAERKTLHQAIGIQSEREKEPKKREQEHTRRKHNKPKKSRKAALIGIAAVVVLFAGAGFALLFGMFSGGEKDLPDVTPLITGGLDDVIVVEAPADLTIENVVDFEFIEGQTYQFEPKIVPEQYQDIEIIYTSEDESIVTVDEDGVATAVSAGTTRITVSAGGVSITITVVVYEGEDEGWETYQNYTDNNAGTAENTTPETLPEEPAPTPPAEPEPTPSDPEPSTPEGTDPTVT